MDKAFAMILIVNNILDYMLICFQFETNSITYLEKLNNLRNLNRPHGINFGAIIDLLGLEKYQNKVISPSVLCESLIINFTIR